jgi:hypothetical protein
MGETGETGGSGDDDQALTQRGNEGSGQQAPRDEVVHGGEDAAEIPVGHDQSGPLWADTGQGREDVLGYAVEVHQAAVVVLSRQVRSSDVEVTGRGRVLGEQLPGSTRSRVRVSHLNHVRASPVPPSLC